MPEPTTFEQTLETLKSGAIKPNSDEMDAAVLKKALEEYNLEHPDEVVPVAPEPIVVDPVIDLVIDPVIDPNPDEPKKLSDDEIISVEEDTLSDEDKQRRTGIIKVRDDAVAAEFEKEVELYSKAEKMTIDEAKKAIEAEKKLAEQYQNDPRKLSRTARYWQSQHAKLEAKVKSNAEATSNRLGENDIIIQGKKTTFDAAKDVMVDAFRNQFGDDVIDKTDDEIFEIAKSDYKSRVHAHYEQQAVKIADEAKMKRAKMILELPDHAKPFRKEIEDTLNILPDSKIAEHDYSPDGIIEWVRGRHYTPDKLKEIEEAAFKRGRENAKILGEKVGTPAGASKTSKSDLAPSADKEVESMTRDQKDQAMNMFDGIKHWDEQKKFKEYISVMKDTGRWTNK